MKAYKKNIFYKIKHIVPTIGMAGLTVAACCKPDIREDTIPQKQETEIPTEPIDSTKLHDVELMFSVTNISTMFSLDTLQKYIDDKTVKTIYMVTTGHWSTLGPNNISNMRKNLQPCMELSTKLRGRGNFDFRLGAASCVPNDSLWFVQQGWTINKDRQK